MSLKILQSIIDSGTKLTPMMDQYYSIKKNYMEDILFFRMGDFYEVFFEDAQKSSKLLNITLTHRGKIGDTPIPMAGIPHHAAAVYIDRLTAMGLKVAICEQVEDPKETKGIVKRQVTQVASPGMPFDLDKTSSNENRFMACASKVKGQFYLVLIDYTTGEFLGHHFTSEADFIERLRMIHPKELITFMGQWEENPNVLSLCDHFKILRTHLSEEYFESKYTEVYTTRLIPGIKTDKVLKSEPGILPPLGALAYYICSTQGLEEFGHLRSFRIINDQGHMKVTLPTLAGLEILPKSRDSYKNSLLGFLDKTQTAMGSRKLRQLICSPLLDKEVILKRQNLIESLLNDFSFLESIRESFSEIRDLDRIMAKISTGRGTAGDLLNLAHAIEIYSKTEKEIHKLTKGLCEKVGPADMKKAQALRETIEKTINCEIGASLEKGNLIKPGCNKKRDRLASLSRSTHKELEKLETRYREETGITKLRVKSNNVAGFFIEISKSHTSKIPSHFERRQTLVNSERYTTTELSQFEKEMLSAKEKLERLEREIFKDIIEESLGLASIIQKKSDIIALLDSFAGLAWVSKQEGFSRPTINKEKGIHLKMAWHPLIKSLIRDEFVPHDLNLDSDNFFGLITGPNMAGKTTVMREVAIIQVMTQMGSFVPAKEVKLSLCDYLFSRLGASDDILKGQSTFMVEMAETAEIIRHSTERSLIILDEVGRGTSTYDGLSIAWSLVEHLVKKTKALSLFATHYHELIELAEQLNGAKNLTVETKNIDGNVQFMYRLINEGASQSYGIYVAKLAGLPPSILQRSQQILKKLETGKESKAYEEETDAGCQLTFFMDSGPIVEIPAHLKKLQDHIKKVDLSRTTPLEALNLLNDLKEGLNLDQARACQ